MYKLFGVEVCDNDNRFLCKLFDDFFIYWKIGIEGFIENVVLVLENNCWEVAFIMIDCLFKLSVFCSLDNVVSIFCFVIEKIMNSVSKIVWRL